MMTLLLLRRPSGPASTIGQLFERVGLGLVGLCFTCEDVVRASGVKVAGQTAIPAGTYRVVITESARFKRPLPLLLNVPGFEGVRIHPGNTAEDTEGCILLGERAGTITVFDSRAACARVQARIEEALKREEDVMIEIRNTEAA